MNPFWWTCQVDSGFNLNRFKENKKKILFEKPSGLIDLYKNNKKKNTLWEYMVIIKKKNEYFLGNM